MSRCFSVIARETLVFPPRWKRHLIEDGICKRCLQPEFVKQKKKFVAAVFPEQVDIAKEILGIE